MPPNVHDSGYKLLFSNRTIFRQLIETFVDAPWVKEADFSRCEPVDKSFVADDYRQRESDLLYRIALRGEEFYIYVLIEFQSTVDRFMAVRVLNYLTSFYLDYVRAHRSKLRRSKRCWPRRRRCKMNTGGPAYWIPPSRPRPANVVPITATNAHLLQPLFPWVLPLPQPPRHGVLVATVVQEMVVALCYCARIPDQVTHAGVETAEAFRGHGYATAAVVGWAAEVRRQGLNGSFE